MEEKRRPGLYDFLSWKEKLLLYAAIATIAVGSTALSVWLVEGGFTLESRLGHGRMTPAKKERMYKEWHSYR
ncbi:hypothetical protein KY326_02165 [Candidatus Woesearchaeota archaeon]|nr:hypothetical protein [Candidatus Woesearchaeota archaeon]